MILCLHNVELVKFLCRLIEFLVHAESVAHVMEGYISTPNRCLIFRCLHSHPFVDDIAIECDEVDKSSEVDEVMQRQHGY